VPVIAAQSAIQSHATSNVSSITQKAVFAALSGPQDEVEQMRRAYRERRDRLYEWLTAEPLISCHKPAGAFYLFPDLRRALAATGFATTIDFAQALLDEVRVAITPGEAFDTPGFARLSCAASLDDLREGSRRLVEFTRAHAIRPEAVPG
jgi:aspartate/methionine/tyrosine aminotransferase